MKASATQRREESAIDLIEEAVHLLRTAPLPVLMPWLIGTVPFILALLYFWADMSGGAFAGDRIGEASLGMAAVFLWMKFWHAQFAVKVRAFAASRDAAPLTIKTFAGMLATQAIIQPFGLFLIPMAAVTVLPFPWVYAFFQNVTAVGNGQRGVREAISIAARFADDSRMQHIRLLVLMSCFSLIVLANWFSLGFVLPDLVRTLSGYQSTLSLNAFAILNSTFFAVICSLTFLCIDPILKTTYVLRCFHSESVHSGEDLVSELRRVKSGAWAAALVIGTLLCFGTLQASENTQSAQPMQKTTVSQPAATDPAQLERAIEEVLSQSKYSWRAPRKREKSDDEGIIMRFLRDSARAVKKFVKKVWDWLEELILKLLPKPKDRPDKPSGLGWIFSSQVLLWLLLAAVVAVLAIVLMRWRRSRRGLVTAQALPLQPAPNLNDENVGPEQLPEDGWIRLGRELLAKGEYRLALRAFYLSSLALLAERKFITLARFKSNRDYARELHRRAHQLPALLETFNGNVSIFEHAWYGRLELDEPAVTRFADAVQQMRATA